MAGDLATQRGLGLHEAGIGDLGFGMLGELQRDLLDGVRAGVDGVRLHAEGDDGDESKSDEHELLHMSSRTRGVGERANC